MNFLEAIYLIGHTLNTLSAESIKSQQKYSQFTKGIKKQLTGPLHLPNIVLKGINVNGKFVKTGSIVVRPLTVEFITDIINEYHNGVVLGTDESGVEYIIEITKGKDINILTKEKFLDKFSENRLEVDASPPKDLSLEEIFNRAKKHEDKPYSLLNFNCIDFAYNIIFEKEPIRRGDEINKIILSFNDFCYVLDEMLAKNSKDQGLKNFHQRNLNSLKEKKAIISASIKNPNTENNK